MMSSLLSAVDALRASSGQKWGWPSTEKGAFETILDINPGKG